MPGLETPEIYWDNRWESGSLTATSAASGFGVDSLADADLRTAWRADTTGPAELQADFPVDSIQEADAWLLDNHNLDGLELSLVVASSLNFFDATTVEVFTANTSAPLLRRFSSVTFASAKVNVPTVTGSPAQIGEMFVGPRFTLERNPVAPFDPDETMAKVLRREAESGRRVQLPRFTRRMVNANFTNVSSAFYADIKSWYDSRASKGLPFWWAFRPATDPAKAFYCTWDGDRLTFPLTPFRRNGTLTLSEEI